MESGTTIKSLMIRSISILAMLMLLFPILVQPIRQNIFHARSAAIRTMEPTGGNLKKMVFTTEEFSRLNFTRPQKEFVYLDNMYDVQSITITGNRVVILALWDAPESHLLMAMVVHGKIGHTMASPGGHIDFLPWFRVYRQDINPVTPFAGGMDFNWIPVLYNNPECRTADMPPEFLIRS